MTEEAAEQELAGARIITTKTRSAEVPLDWPITFGDQIYEKIIVRRATGREIEKFIDDLADSKAGERPKPPIIDCPIEVYEALDDDDRLRLEEAMLPFMPRRLQTAIESILMTTDATSGA